MTPILRTFRRGMTSRTLGIVLSMIVLVGVLTLIALATVRGSRAEQERARAGRQDIAPPVLPTNRQPTVTGEIEELIGTADEGIIQLVNEQNVVVQELKYETFNPQEAGRYNVTEPEAWVYMNDGTSISIHADELNYVQPSGSQEPEKGRFSGNVRIRVFPAVDASGNPAPRAGDDPDALGIEAFSTIRTDSMTFDSAIGELSTADEVTITSTGIEARFVGLTIVADEQNKRLAYLEAQRDGVVTIDPDALQSRRGSRGQDGAPGQGGPDDEPVEQQYHVELADQVRFVTSTQTLDADRLHVWATLLDGSLPENAIAPLVTSTRDGASGGASDTGRPDGSGESELLTVTWTGPLTIRPVIDPVEQLEHDHVAIRLESPESGVVRIDDSETGASLQAVALAYGMTTRSTSLIGAGDTGVRVRLPGQADILVGRLDANLTTGLASVHGPGEIRASDPDAQIDRDQRIVWQQGAQFTLATRDGQVDLDDPMLLREATLTGASEARRDDRVVQGELIRAWFGITDDRQASIERLLVEGSARADAGDDGQLSARRIDVSFSLDSTLDDPRPSRLIAEGTVRGSRGEALIEGELLDATLVGDAQGNPQITDVHASRAVRVRTPQGDEVSAEDLRASIPDGVYDMTGTPVTLRRDEVTVSGGSIRLEEIAQRMTVFGSGTLESTRRSEAGAGYESMTIDWQDSMIYDGQAGFAEFIGRCVARAQMPDARDNARAERIVVALQPDASVADDGQEVDARDVVDTITLYGASHEGTGDESVTIESRRYTPDASSETGVRLEGLLYLESRLVEANVQTDVLSVPQTGRLLIENRSQSDGGDQEPERGAPFDGQGTTLLTWSGAMELQRAESRAILRDRVRLRHLPPGADAYTELECELLDASVDLPGSPGTIGLERTQLRNAIASGAVYARRDTKQLIADRLVYDATRGVAEATAALGNSVTMFDATHPTPLTGSLLRWDVVRDRVEWRDAGEMTVPRD
ncbi:MAG: hypothetical protein ACF8GE_03180 [Phycisphaerales bacterium JB043]